MVSADLNPGLPDPVPAKMEWENLWDTLIPGYKLCNLEREGWVGGDLVHQRRLRIK